MKWSKSWQISTSNSKGAKKKFQVKVNQLKLQGFDHSQLLNLIEDEMIMRKISNTIIMVEVKWKCPKHYVFLMVPFSGRRSKCQTYYSSQFFLRKIDHYENLIQWGDEFESICSLFSNKESIFSPSHLTFKLLYGHSSESNKAKLGVLGKVKLSLMDLFSSTMDSKIQRKLPFHLKLAGTTFIEATLCVCISFDEVRNSQEVHGINVQDSTESDTKRIVRRVNYFRSFRKISNNENIKDYYIKQQVNSDSDDSFLLYLSEDSKGNESTTTNVDSYSDLGSNTKFESLRPSPQIQSDPSKKSGLFLSWKRRRLLSFRSPSSKGGPLIHKTCCQVKQERNSTGSSLKKEGVIGLCGWETREIVSRDRQVNMKTKVFLASFDQRSELAAGESACTVLVTVIAHWLHSNQHLMPRRSQLDSLIREGSSEWRKLCCNEAYLNLFPNKHFDLETVLEARVRTLNVQPEKSFVGFFCPEKFACLKKAMAFDEIWEEISRKNNACQSSIYIVSWNDHFFILKVEADAYYIIDSLGERLFEGCKKAYILKFDNTSVMYRKEEEQTREETRSIERQEVICRGKECCREFIQRFLAAIQVRELEEEQRKGTVSNLTLHHRLQIEFHFSNLSTYSLSSSTTLSFCSNEDCV